MTATMSPTDRLGDGRYTLETELARGGMGRIWVAHDTRLSRRVAIKELLEPSGGHRARFERELALTSRLEHPSIVSIQDGGTWPDGKPFYVMRLVSGESLGRLIERTAIGDRIGLLPYGLAMVDAVAYAHAQGIVHRDLKPDNVLVGDFGETVVIDWGLAKDLRATTPDLIDGPYRALSRDGETLGGEVLGTPAYMPPEQALGDAVDERADVYALGAVLYHLLSGSRPYLGATVEEVLARVISAPPPSLATRAPNVPADLITIVDKAMARNPDDRYTTAGELAVDLKRFQSGQLVGAHRYTGSQLLRRWLRRHRTAVVVAALAAITLAALGAVSFARIVREQREAEAARQLAEHQRALADDRRIAAEGLVTFMLGDLRNSLEPLGKLALLELPARKSLEYFDARGELAPDERASRALALENLGEALRNRGDFAGAETSFRAAIAERGRLAAEGHASADLRYLDGTLHDDLADLLLLRGATADAIAEYRATLAIFSALTSERPSDKRGPRGQELILEKLGGALVAQHDFAGAKHEYGAALEIATARAHAAPDDVEAQLDMVAPEHAVGDALVASGDPAGALAVFRATHDRLAAQVARTPDDMPVVRMLQLTQHRIGTTLLALGDPRGAVLALRDGEALSERLVAREPDHLGWRFEQALNLARLAQALAASGDPAGAIATYERGIALLRALPDADAAKNLMVLHIELSELLAAQKRSQLAEMHAREAVAIGEHRAEQDPTNRLPKKELTDGYAALGGALLALHRPADAIDVFARGVDVERTLATSAADDMPLLYNLQDDLVNLANLRCATRGHGDPHATYEEALAISARQLTAAPSDAKWRELDREARNRAEACRP